MSRLTDEELADLLTWNQKNDDAYMTAYEARQLLIELKERRAADLKPEEVEALRNVRDIVANTQFLVSTFINNITGATREDTSRRDFALSVLDRLLPKGVGR